MYAIRSYYGSLLAFFMWGVILNVNKNPKMKSFLEDNNNEFENISNDDYIKLKYRYNRMCVRNNRLKHRNKELVTENNSLKEKLEKEVIKC